jgi:hypothetical protein
MIIDQQVMHIDTQKMHQMATWLADRLKRARQRRADAEKSLTSCGFLKSDPTDVDKLMAEFAAQRAFQSQPIESRWCSRIFWSYVGST